MPSHGRKETVTHGLSKSAQAILEHGLALQGALAGLPLFLLVMLAPMLFLGGLVKVFKSSTWTLSYRELCAMEQAAADEVPASAGATLEAASVS